MNTQKREKKIIIAKLQSKIQVNIGDLVQVVMNPDTGETDIELV